jgi:fimbrial chaperone protein
MRRLFACAVSCLLFPAAAGAADISVLPVGLSLSARQDRQAITVTNQGKESVTMQVDTVAWTQVDGEDKYAPTQDLLVNPPLFSILPGRSQILRVGLSRPPGGEREVAYRLFLREVPPSLGAIGSRENGDNGKVRVLLELRLPVYVAPTKVVRAQQWHARRNVDGGIAVDVVNTGNVHLVVGELKLRAADAAPDAPPLALTKTSTAVFPGQSRRWEVRPEQPLTSQRIVLEVATDRGPQNVVLDLVP